MSLTLEIEYLLGVVFAAQGPESEQADWPPQPDRVFSALVATFGAHGAPAAEADALRWLEELDPPLISASPAGMRSAAQSFVPPNDPASGRSGNKTVVPLYRKRQPRRFPAAHPHNRVVRLFWENVFADPQQLKVLQSLAADTSYVGHSASLTRCRFSADSPAADWAPPQSATRRTYRGRLIELQENYARFISTNGKAGRPRPGDIVFVPPPAPAPVPQSCFDEQWLVLENGDEWLPDVRASALVAREIRNALLSGFNQANLGDQIPASVSGHEPDGTPAKEPHLAIIPLAFTGFEFADGHLLGFALIPPRGTNLLEIPGFRAAMRKIAPVAKTTGRRTLSLAQSRIKLSPTVSSKKASLQPMPFIGPAHMFATVTPIVLDRHLKEQGAAREGEIVAQIETACHNIGLPIPVQIIADKHSAFEGAASAQPSGNAPAWMRWRLPPSLGSRALTHAVIRFASPVKGPILLGAGRFVGLGLCRPIADNDGDR